jgi:hypothetical protein
MAARDELTCGGYKSVGGWVGGGGGEASIGLKRAEGESFFFFGKQ